eukprot:TRINITY_DN3565_c0_g1_i1.p1 TRINITY_DN3565_c0_g1~~TRINITY_DN3565_c0_g1_i1.p1  ORF type:complete len:299 (+),score=20.29 TRINITY_DN3565_c0_g1_i1:295-1191(+)
MAFHTKKRWHSYVIGGLSSCVGESVTMPLDVAKVRMQVSLSGRRRARDLSLHKVLHGIVRREGVTALWTGMIPALLRQILYGGLRIGLYTSFKESLPPAHPWLGSIVSGVFAGGLAAAVANPFDVVKTRMQVLGTPAKPRFTSFSQGFIHISRKHGMKGLYRGWLPTAQRAAVVAAVELGTYDETKGYLREAWRMNDGPTLHIFSALMSGLLATIICAPIDFIKTRVQGQEIGGDSYKNAVDCFRRTVSAEGPLALWTGVTAHYLRRGPHLILSFLALEQMRNFVNGGVWNQEQEEES